MQVDFSRNLWLVSILLLEEDTQETMEVGEQDRDISGERWSNNKISESLGCIWTSQG